MTNRGGSFERETSKFLTKWLTGKVKPYFFWRSPGSGSIGTIHEENEHLKGDIIPIKNEVKAWWPFVIECKTGYKRTSFFQHINSTNFAIEDFWRQTVEETPKNKISMLIYRKKNRKPIIGIDSKLSKKLNKKIKNLNCIKLHWNSNLIDCLLYDMNSFFDSIKPNDLKNINN